MADMILNVLLGVGIVLISAFIVVGLSSRRVRDLLQQPADEMLRQHQARWGRTDERR